LSESPARAPADDATSAAPPKEDAGESQHDESGKPKTDDGSKTQADDAVKDQKDGDSEEDKPPKKGLKERPILVAVIIGVLVLAAVGGLIFWLIARNYESTDDAFIDTHIVRLAPQVSGRVTQVLVGDNQAVNAGQPLIAIDSADLETRVAQAKAQEAQAEAQVDNARVQIAVNEAAYQQALADVDAASAPAENAAQDLARYRRLRALNPAAVDQQQLDQLESQARQTGAQYDAAVRAARAKAEQVKASRTQVTSGEDQERAAQSQLNEANINFGYARIAAPLAGHVAQKTVAVGNYVEPGTQLMAIVPLKIWVTANFKETQLDLMRAGQKVTLKVDACPQDKIKGHVDSIQRGAGQAFSLLPPENATGNYVKVVQRVPVKIVIDNPPNDCWLGPGMSVEPTVKVR
jgi:membrane fusion protein (multidrug efflux system)